MLGALFVITLPYRRDRRLDGKKARNRALSVKMGLVSLQTRLFTAAESRLRTHSQKNLNMMITSILSALIYDVFGITLNG